MTPQESVSALIKVIESKGVQHSGTFWTWENKVSIWYLSFFHRSDFFVAIPLVKQHAYCMVESGHFRGNRPLQRHVHS